MAIIMVIFTPTGSALVVLHDHGVINQLPDNVFITSTTQNTITIRSDDPDFVTDVYSAGAIFVLPALNNGCIALR